MITQGYLARHFQGRSGMRDPALLDVAQDYALKYLHDQGAFELGIVLKGGTSLRKLRAGNAGRFSTDLDFATPDLETAAFLLDTLDGAELFDVRFSLEAREPTRAKLIVDTPLGRPAIPARVEISPRKLWLATEPSTPIALPVHAGYEFTPPAIPAPALEESLAEKLAAWRHEIAAAGGHRTPDTARRARGMAEQCPRALCVPHRARRHRAAPRPMQSR
jgi:uncharacterized protein